MEFLSESERYEHGGLSRDFDLALAVAALQLLVTEPVVEEPEAA